MTAESDGGAHPRGSKAAGGGESKGQKGTGTPDSPSATQTGAHKDGHARHERRALEPPQSAGWRSRDIIRAAALTVGVVALAVGVWEASTVVFTIFLGILFGLAISAGADQLARWHIPRALGVMIVVLAVAGVLTLLGALMAPTLSDQGREIRSRLPLALHQLQSWVSREGGSLRAFTGRFSLPTPSHEGPAVGAGGGGGAGAGAQHGDSTGGPRTPSATPAPSFQDGGGQTAQGLAGVAGYLFEAAGSTVEIVVYVLLALFISLYVASDPDLYHRGLMHLFPHRARARAGDVLTHIASVLRKWLVTQLIAMVTLAVAWAIALSILDVKAALALAVIAGLLEFVPTIGPTMAVVPALAMALLDSPGKAVSVLIVYLVIQGLEANVLVPLLMQGRIELPPALTIVAQALMTLAFGFIGLMVAVPLLAAAMVPIKLLYVEDVVGDNVSPEGEDSG